ncbi:MAG TPA: hypothetical protein VM639_00070 [Dongiaceae bacterium]|nr:hypothetical protein [Dongiaceae bacterium]
MPALRPEAVATAAGWVEARRPAMQAARVPVVLGQAAVLPDQVAARPVAPVVLAAVLAEAPLVRPARVLAALVPVVLAGQPAAMAIDPGEERCVC